MHHFSFPTQIVVGRGSRHALVSDLRTLTPDRKLLIVSEAGISRLPFFQEICQEIEASGVPNETYFGVQGNPDLPQVQAGSEIFVKRKCDTIVAIGGGAVIDVAKAIAVDATQEHPLFEYVDEPGARTLVGDLPEIFALPTTAGTGSEVGRAAVISEPETRVKKIIFSPKLLPKRVYLDAEVTVGLPPAITAATGFDALTHLLEAFLTPTYHPMCDGIALEGIRKCLQFLIIAWEEPDNLQAREEMLVASMMGAVAFQKGLALTHSFAHALSTLRDLHHGLANGIMVDHVMRFYLDACPEKWALLQAHLGLSGNRPGESLIAELQALKEKVQIPSDLSSLRLSTEEVKNLVAHTLADTCHRSGPKPVTESDLYGILKKANPKNSKSTQQKGETA